MAVAQGDLLERERELDMLAEAFTAVDADSGGRLALVHGEAGVGKTALVRRFCGDHEATAREFSGARASRSSHPAPSARSSMSPRMSGDGG